MLSVVVEDRIWCVDRPVWFSGVKLRARTTIVRLADGGLVVHSPAPPSDALADELAALGTVRWLVVPNGFHHLGTPPAAARWPDAKVVGPASAAKKNPALRIDVPIAGAQLPDLDALPLDGVPFLDETVFYHRPTQTLLGVDLVIAAGPADHWTWRLAARVTGCYQRLRVPPDVRKKIVDPAAAARSLRAMLDRPIQRLIVAHAGIAEDGCRDLLADAWRREGVAV